MSFSPPGRIFPKDLVRLDVPFCIVDLPKMRSMLRYVQDTFADKSEELRHIEGSLKDFMKDPWDDGNFQIRFFDPKSGTFSAWEDSDYNDAKYRLIAGAESQVRTGVELKVKAHGAKAAFETVQLGGDLPKSKLRPVFRLNLHFGDTKIINDVGQGVYREQVLQVEDMKQKGLMLDVAYTTIRCDLGYGIGLSIIKYLDEQIIDGKKLPVNLYWKLIKGEGEKGKYEIKRVPEQDMVLPDGTKIKGAHTRYAELTKLAEAEQQSVSQAQAPAAPTAEEALFNSPAARIDEIYF